MVKEIEIESLFSFSSRFQITTFLALGYAPSFSCDTRPLGAAYLPILLSEVEQEQTFRENGDRGAILVGAGLCDGVGERTDTVYDPTLGEEIIPYTYLARKV